MTFAEPQGAPLTEVELFTHDGKYVATVEVLPFDPPPTVIMWGTRTFARLEATKEAPASYREAFAVYSLTPSPGIPRRS